METKVVHCKQEYYDILIDRSTIWGNPYREGVDGTRAECIEKYRNYILNTPELLGQLYTLEGKILGCWCKPKACHGDVLVELTNKLKNVKIVRKWWNI